MKEYSETFKRKMVERMLSPGGPTQSALAAEVGISQTTLSRWAREARTLSGMSKKPPSDLSSKPTATRPRTRERSPEDKLRLVMEAQRLSDQELGEFLRREGLHASELDEWKQSMVEALRPARSRTERRLEEKRIQKLEKELKRKDKALAEAAALLVLQKKVRDIWGDEDDDTTPRNDK